MRLPDGRIIDKDLAKARGIVCKKICGTKVWIQKINPLELGDSIPQLFSYNRMPVERLAELNKAVKKDDYYKRVAPVFHAGLVYPILQTDPAKGWTVEDLYRDVEFGSNVYGEIIQHSLRKYRGIRGFFLSLKITFKAFIMRLRTLGKAQLNMSTMKADTQT